MRVCSIPFYEILENNRINIIPKIVQKIRFRGLKLEFLICLVTPTYKRLEQEPELFNMFSNPNLHKTRAGTGTSQTGANTSTSQ